MTGYNIDRPWVFDFGVQVVSPKHIIVAVPDLGYEPVNEELFMAQLEALAREGFFEEA